MTAPKAPDPLAAIARARGTARLIVTTTPGVTMTVLAQEDLVDAIAAALAREAERLAALEAALRAAIADCDGCLGRGWTFISPVDGQTRVDCRKCAPMRAALAPPERP